MTTPRSFQVLALLSTTGLLGGVAAQTQTTRSVELPLLNPVPKTSDVPFSQPKIRYQQWYESRQLQSKIKQPVRIVGLEFLGAIPNGITLDIEVTLANTGSTLTGNFEQNFLSEKLVVIPRTRIPAAGASTLLTFKNDWIYDGQSNVVVDIRIWDNGTGQRFNYAAKSTVTQVSNVKRQYFVGNPNATTANSSGATGHYGLHTRFLYQDGGSFPYGTGCPGANSVTPVATSSAVPLPGLSSWTQHVDRAGSGYPAALLIGVSDKTSAGVPLPFPLTFLGAPNCSAFASWEFILFTKTVGGGPGTGSAKIPTPIPAIGALGGVKIYTQWLVFDRGAANGNLSASNALMHVVGS